MTKYKCPKCKNDLFFDSRFQKTSVFCETCKRSCWIKAYKSVGGTKCHVIFHDPYKGKVKVEEQKNKQISWMEIRLLLNGDIEQGKQFHKRRR